jgi:thiol-disulfide isomerase/thioredoxin
VSRKEIAVLLVVAVLAGLLGLGLAVARHGPGSLARTPLGHWLEGLGNEGVAIGDVAPRIVVNGFDGHRHAFPTIGRPTLINYWASWCGPCRAELPLLNSFTAQQGGNGIHVVGIALEEADAARAFLASVPVGYPTFWEAPSSRDSSVRLGNTHGVLPYTVLVDAQGRIRARRVGAFTDVADLRAWLDSAGVPAR